MHPIKFVWAKIVLAYARIGDSCWLIRLLHEGRDFGPCYFREAVERPEEFTVALDDPHPRFVTRYHR